MGFIRRLYDRLLRSTPERKAARAHLKAAKLEDQEQYLGLVNHYLDLALTFYGSTLPEPVENRLARTEQLFAGLWQHLRYAERLSDFEYMLGRAQIDNCAERGPLASSEPLVTKLRLLEPHARFAYLTHEFENWSERWVTLIMRVRPPALHRMLSEARCELCGVSWASLSREERECLEAVSVAFEQCTNLRANKALHERIKPYPRVLEIKAQWLELRPALVEVRHRYLPSQEEREQLLAAILQSCCQIPMQRPPLVDRMVNTVHFSRHAKIKVS
ncbi:hypothetical protein [Coraliomargarita parva]|uniref:hypothetical protein n=1 Tax=Coraliomargarita parva TaxID=3014050 RepID=UPI0022B4E8DB|nr:hypothetical protein [Coraliomargarita parva]